MSKIPVKGIFVGAKVIRGPDWDWGNQVRDFKISESHDKI